MDTTTVAPPSLPDTRETRALELFRARGRDIVLVDVDTYEVPSQDGVRRYEVVYGGEVESCTCPDHAHRSVACVHLLAAAVKRAKRRGATARRLATLEERYEHEDLDPESRLELLEELRALRRRVRS